MELYDPTTTSVKNAALIVRNILSANSGREPNAKTNVTIALVVSKRQLLPNNVLFHRKYATGTSPKTAPAHNLPGDDNELYRKASASSSPSHER